MLIHWLPYFFIALILCLSLLIGIKARHHPAFGAWLHKIQPYNYLMVAALMLYLDHTKPSLLLTACVVVVFTCGIIGLVRPELLHRRKESLE